MKNPSFWLFKSEPDVYSIDHLSKDSTTLWEGVRNYQARNFMRDTCKVGDQVLFYHSNAEPSGVAGLATVTKVGVPDPSQFKKGSEYFDKKSDPKNPTWICVEVKFKEKFSAVISLADLKNHPELAKMLVVQKGQRLSIQPVTAIEFNFIINKLAHGK
jgi:predicted RNA-binding protein with PUA-like domain